MFLDEVATNGPQFFYLVPWVVFFPVIGLLVNMIFGGWMGEKAVGAVASTASGLAFLVAILLAPLAIKDIPAGTRWIIFLACLAVLGFSVAFSKRGSIAEEPAR